MQQHGETAPYQKPDFSTDSFRFVANLRYCVGVIRRHWKMIVKIVCATSVAAVVVSLILPKNYKAEAVIIPVSAKAAGGLSALASQFGGMASMMGLSLPQSADDGSKILAILNSRTLAENVVKHENLLPVLNPSKWDAEKNRWKSSDPKKIPRLLKSSEKMRKKMMSFKLDKKLKVIKIAGVFPSSELSARVVNAYLDELQKFISANAFTMAKRNRIFIEGQLAENKRDLLEAGKEINEYYRSGRISSSEANVDVTISREIGANPALKGDGAQALDGVGATGAGASDRLGVVTAENEPKTAVDVSSDPDSKMVSLMAQKSDIEKAIADANIVQNVPQQVYLSYLMLRREILGKVNALLASQYEMAKMEEAKDELSFQVIDRAVPPFLRNAPKRTRICVMSFFVSLFIAVSTAFFKEHLENMRAQGQLGDVK